MEDKPDFEKLHLINQLDEEDKTTVFKIIDTMLTKKKFKDFFQKNVGIIRQQTPNCSGVSFYCSGTSGTLAPAGRIIQSMSRKGNCLDNAIIENFFGTLKSELFYTQKFKSTEELKQQIKEYINYYNNERIKSNLNKMSPIKYRTHLYQN